MKARHYQEEHISKIVESVSSKRKIIAQLPTGGGKTVEFALIAQRYIRSTGKSVLILVHRKELMYQAKKTILNICDIDACLITAGSNQFRISRIYIGMVESVVSRLNLFDNVGLVIVDEAHIANFNKIHSIFLDELIIGFTATPVSANKRLPLSKFYNDIQCGPQIRELIDNNWLSQNITRCPKDIVDTLKFEVDKLKGDYNERQMSSEYQIPKHVINAVRNYKRFCKGKKTLVFNVSIEHSKQVNDCFKTFGLNSRHLASDNESERDEILKWYKETEDAILCNVMIATVGFDEPTVECILINFATLSLPKFIQCCGRGSRIIDNDFIRDYQHEYPYKLKLKDRFNIIDMGANWCRFGDWSDERDWEWIFNNPPVIYDGVAPVKRCPECDGLVHAAARICTCKNDNEELCLYEFERKRIEESIEEQEMIIVTKGFSVEKIAENNKKKYAYFTMFKLGEYVVKSMLETYRNPDDSIKQKYFKKYYIYCIEWYNNHVAGVNGAMYDISHSGFHIKMALNNFNRLIDKYSSYTVDRYNPGDYYIFDEYERNEPEEEKQTA